MGILEIHKLNKSFGKQKVIKDLNLNVPEGSIFGFVGQNGSGKTTTMKIILGLLKADSGVITVCGERVIYGGTRTNRNIGFLPDVPEFYSYMKPKEYLNLCGEIAKSNKQKSNKQKSNKQKSNKQAEELLALVGLTGENKRIGGFSRGMKQRLGIAQALLSRPRLLICDEPTSALDPIGRKEILDILRKISDTTTVLFSTHILPDVERICDNVAVLHDGNIAISGTLSEIRGLHKKDSLLLEFASREELQRFKSGLSVSKLIAGAEEKETEIVFHSENLQEIQRIIFSTLEATKVYPLKLEVLEPTLENLFMEAVQ